MGQVSSSRWECRKATGSCGVEEGGGSEAAGGDRGIDISILGVDRDLEIHVMTEERVKNHSMVLFVTGCGSWRESILGASLSLLYILGLTTFWTTWVRCLERNHMDLGNTGRMKDTQCPFMDCYSFLSFHFTLILSAVETNASGNKTLLPLASKLMATFFSCQDVCATGPVMLNHQTAPTGCW